MNNRNETNYNNSSKTELKGIIQSQKVICTAEPKPFA